MSELQLDLPLPVVKSPLVKEANAVARAVWSPPTSNILDKRIFSVIASKVHIDDEDFYTYRIPIKEFFNSDKERLTGRQYEDIKKSILNLARSYIKVEEGKNNFKIYSVFSMCGYIDGFIETRFDPDLKPFFLNLSAHFTTYRILDYLNLQSIYSQTLFLILRSWDDKPEVELKMDYLHETLNSAPTQKKDFSQFRLRILNKAQKDIHKFTDLRFKWEPVKQGSKVIAIRFIFSEKRQVECQNKEIKIEQKKKSVANNKLVLSVRNCRKSKGLQKGERCNIITCTNKMQEFCNNF